jgi:hypothetical protein
MRFVAVMDGLIWVDWPPLGQFAIVAPPSLASELK